ncbi:MAG: hypothetical protein ABI628_07300 [Chloroflexota bacterium]
MGTIAAFGLAACGQNGPTPTPAPQGAGPSSTRSASIPRPNQATSALGSSGPGYDGSSDFLSFASALSPARALTAYIDQLLDAGYRDAGRQGAWWVFVDSSMTVWVRVGSAGPPTSLLVRFARTEDAGPDSPAAVSQSAGPAPAEPRGTGSQSAGSTTKPGAATTSTRRPDPPHAASQAGSPAGGTAGGGSTAGPGASPGPATGPAAGSGTVGDSSGGGSGSRP